MQRLISTLSTPKSHPVGGMTRTSLMTSVETWLRDLKSQVPSRIDMAARLDPTPEVAMDPEQVRTVTINLVLNAVEAILDQGLITVETRTDEDWATLTVTDTGRGMSAAFVRDRLFRPFQTTKPRGLGIGLYQCRHIVQALGGDLTAESQEGKGTRMIVRLPPAQPRSEPNQSVESVECAESVEFTESRVVTQHT
jgi:signal transduction histidine kinase